MWNEVTVPAVPKRLLPDIKISPASARLKSDFILSRSYYNTKCACLSQSIPVHLCPTFGKSGFFFVTACPIISPPLGRFRSAQNKKRPGRAMFVRISEYYQYAGWICDRPALAFHPSQQTAFITIRSCRPDSNMHPCSVGIDCLPYQ